MGLDIILVGVVFSYLLAGSSVVLLLQRLVELVHSNINRPIKRIDIDGGLVLNSTR